MEGTKCWKNAMALMESPRFALSKVLRHKDPVAIFYLNNEFRVMRKGMRHYRRNYLCYPDALMGIYTQQITEPELREDMAFMVNSLDKKTV